MKAYILTFIVTILLALISDYLLKKGNIKTAKLFLFMSLLVPCFIAGVRNEYVGKDVHNYLSLLYRDFSNGASFLSEYKMYGLSGVEPLFMLLVYFPSKLSNFNIVFFIVELAVVLPVYYFAYKQKDNIPIPLTIFIFLLTMYCYSLSMMRQSVAITICLLGTYYLVNNNFKKSFFSIILAFFFHRTAIIYLMVLILGYIIFKTKKNKVLYLFLLLGGAIIVSISAPIIISFLPSKYSNYLDARWESAVNVLSLIKKIIWIIPLLLCYVKINESSDSSKKNTLLFCIFMVFFDIVFYLIGIKVPTVSRISLYFSNISLFFVIPEILKMFKQKCIITSLCCILLIFFWHHMIINDDAGVYPYKSDVIQFLN